MDRVPTESWGRRRLVLVSALAATALVLAWLVFWTAIRDEQGWPEVWVRVGRGADGSTEFALDAVARTVEDRPGELTLCPDVEVTSYEYASTPVEGGPPRISGVKVRLVRREDADGTSNGLARMLREALRTDFVPTGEKRLALGSEWWRMVPE